MQEAADEGEGGRKTYLTPIGTPIQSLQNVLPG